MNAPFKPGRPNGDAVATLRALNHEWREALQGAINSIAPSWPLDEMIAVNPLWELRDQHINDACARVSALTGAQTLSIEATTQGHQALPIGFAQLQRAAQEMQMDAPEGLQPPEDETIHCRWLNVSMLVDHLEQSSGRLYWDRAVVDEISSFCAHDATISPGGSQLTYAAWRQQFVTNHTLAVTMGTPELKSRSQQLPIDSEGVFEAARLEMGIDAEAATHYATALLFSINGWASRLAWLRWQARLAGSDDTTLEQLLAIRMAWDLLIWRTVNYERSELRDAMRQRWKLQLERVDGLFALRKSRQESLWLWQRAAELSYQDGLIAKLIQDPSTDQKTPELQAVFCIDVRSEVIRRHLETQSPHIQTLGFAGFFGLPIAVQEEGAGGHCRPQLPGLLKPSLKAVPTTMSRFKPVMRQVNSTMHRVAEQPAGIFGLVESMGLGYVLRLMRQSLRSSKRTPLEFEHSSTLSLEDDNGPLSLETRIQLAHTILTLMGMTDNFGQWVLLTGHGSQSRNNPHAAALDCGACGGHTGETNVRLLAELLNDAEVRAGVADKGITIPESTRFIPALHNTTTDDIVVLGSELPTHVREWLNAGSQGCQAERAMALGLNNEDPKALDKKLRTRADDWSQVRPEWGLAGNAAFIAAPRLLTRGKNLEGRTFLHDYDAAKDPEFTTLELILTAPMVVAHWINSQYNFSVANNVKFGSGNKVLHNVVAGNVGVLEGGTGDLRVGLAMQSVHNGEQWMHTPLRLSVYVQAPAEAIQAIYQKHDNVRQLVDGEWLYLFALEGERIKRLLKDQWIEIAS